MNTTVKFTIDVEFTFDLSEELLDDLQMTNVNEHRDILSRNSSFDDELSNLIHNQFEEIPKDEVLNYIYKLHPEINTEEDDEEDDE